MGRLVVRGKYLYEGAQKFFARGVSYGPFKPNSRGERYPEPEDADRDFAMIRQLGANLVRTYVPPPQWMFELAAKHQVRLMLGIPWPFHMAFLDSRGMVRDIRETIRKAISETRGYADNILAYSLGNEIRSDIVRWHGPRAVSCFLSELYDLGKQIAPDSLFTYSNYPSTEYLELDFLDFVSFNVYLHREPDFRRYLTHLLATTRERPLMLTETGMDTIREGEDHQADLLRWQARAAFEMGLSGLVIFAFTDEWNTGGSEITDWAFGLVTRERQPKRAFGAISQIFHGAMPPPLAQAPKASVIIPAYNAAATLPQCLASLTRLNYPDYETIVVDDGSADATATIAESAGVRLVRMPHGGLSAARNAGLAAANGTIAAFIDADAAADPDWLYHLAETLVRTDAPAAGGQNFPPPPASTVAAAISAAPGEPREVRMGSDELAQLSGCNMAINCAKLNGTALFDVEFREAGDDVDFSWQLRECGAKLAYAPGAVVTHERRRTIAAYLRQQRGYGHAEGLLFRKYPRREGPPEGIYGEPRALARWFSAGPRVYYGAFGRGLFQTLYPGSMLPLVAQLPLNIVWVALSVLMLIAWPFSRFFGVLGLLGLILSIACAVAAAIVAPLPVNRSRIPSRVVLATLWLVGPIVRSFERERVKWSFHPNAKGPKPESVSFFGGRFAFALQTHGAAGGVNADQMTSRMRTVLNRRGAAVAVTDGYQPYDLELIVPPCIRATILFVQRGEQLGMRWRLGIAPRRAAIMAVLLVAVLLLSGISLWGSLAITAIIGATAATLAFVRSREIPALIASAANEAAQSFGLKCENVSGGGL